MGFLSVLSFAHRTVREHLQPGDIAVDATAGTGADTAFLCAAVGAKGEVYAFDIQQDALDRTAERIRRLPEVPARVQLLLHSHADMARAVPESAHGRVAAVMFNLGYLPGGDPSIITSSESTLSALDAALSILKPGGVITAVLYPGHEGGQGEAERVEQWARELPEHAGQTMLYRLLNRSSASPYVVAIQKTKRGRIS